MLLQVPTGLEVRRLLPFVATSVPSILHSHQNFINRILITESQFVAEQGGIHEIRDYDKTFNTQHQRELRPNPFLR